MLGVLAAFTGSLVGLERALLPLIAKEEFGIASATLALSFLVTFGVAKALANLGAGRFADRFGRRRVLLVGWLFAVPVPVIVILAPSWTWIVAANALLGLNQGLAWSMALNMKIDLAGARSRGLAVGFNESVGYTGVAVAAYASSVLAADFGLRPVPFLMGAGLAVLGLLLALRTPETARLPRASGPLVGMTDALSRGLATDRSLAAASFAGFANNLKDGLLWGLLPLLLLSRGTSIQGIGFVVALYPLTWAIAQFGFGFLSDRIGRKELIVQGFLVQAVGLVLLVLGTTYASTVAAAVALGIGAGMVYPTLIAHVSDVAPGSLRATAIGVYRFTRDLGYVGGALVGGIVADTYGVPLALASGVLFLVAASAAVAIRIPRWTRVPAMTPIPMEVGDA